MKYFKSDLSREELKKEYKALAKKFHPDVSKDPNAEIIFKEINEEYSNYSFSSGGYTDPYDFYSESCADTDPFSADPFENFYSSYSNPFTEGFDNSVYDNFDVVFFKKVNAHYEGISSHFGGHVDLFDITKDYEGFQVIYRNRDQIVPEVLIHPSLKYKLPSDDDMLNYFIEVVFQESLDVIDYGNEDWFEYIKKHYKLYKYWAFDGENGECYGDEITAPMTKYASFNFYACCYEDYSKSKESTDYPEKYTMYFEYTKCFKVRETLNWFDFPFKVCCKCTFEEFVNSHTFKVPPQTNIQIDPKEGMKILAPYNAKVFANYEVIKFYKMPRNKDIVFGRFDIIELINWIDMLEAKDIENAQKAIDGINAKSMEKLKNLIKKGKVSPGI